MVALGALVVLAFACLEGTFSLFLQRRMSWATHQAAYAFAFLGLISALVQGGLIRRLVPRFGEPRLILAGLTLLAASFVGLALTRTVAELVGAMLVVGNHPHRVQGIETFPNGAVVAYALGNFVFDQTWSEPTMEGITLELTFDGARLVQVRMRPHLILDRAQPNFMDPAGSGAVVMGQVWTASEGLLGW